MDLLKSLFGKKEPSESSLAAEPELVPPVSDAKPIHVTEETFQELVLDASLPALVDFWAPWCGPCRMIAPIVEDLAKTYDGKAVIAKVNTDENVEIAGQLGIMGIPTLILFKNGQEVERLIGFAPRHAIEEKLKSVLN